MNPLMQSFGNNSAIQNFKNIFGIAKMIKSGNPEQIAMNLMQRNPQFKQFVEENKGKTPEQVARENGIDFNQIMGMMK